MTESWQSIERRPTQNQSGWRFLSRKLKSIAASGLALALLVALPGPAFSQDTDNNGATLETIVVSASRTEESIREVTSNITVITQEDLEKYPDSSLSAILSREGFNIRDGATSDIIIRGIRSSTGITGGVGSRVLFLVDGRPALTGNLYQLTKTNVQRIEIIRGSSALVYGSQAMGGVVNIITVRGEGDLSAHVRAGFSSNGFVDQEGGFSGRAGALDYSAGLYRSQTPDRAAEDPLGNFYEQRGDKGQYTGSMNLGYNFLDDLHRIGFVANFYDGNTLGQGPGFDLATWTSPPGYPGDILNRTNKAYDLLYTGRTESDFLNWNTRFYSGKDTYNIANRLTPTEYDRDQESKTDGLQAQLTADWNIVELSGGLDWQKMDFTAYNPTWEPSTTITGDSKNLGAYLTGKLRLMDENLIFTGGVRYDDFKFNSTIDRNIDNWATTFGVAYLPMEWLKLRANFSEGFRAPTSEEMVIGYYDRAWRAEYFPNPDLKPEYSTNYELGFDVNLDYWDFNATYFITDYENFISSLYVPVLSGNQYQNSEKEVTNAGIEFGTSFDVGSYLGWGVEVTPYIKGTWYTERKEFIEDGDSFKEVTTKFVPDKTIVYGVDVTIPQWEMFVNLNASYMGKRRVDRTAPDATLRDTRSYTTVDLTVDKVLATFADKNKISANFAVYNMFNKYAEPDSPSDEYPRLDKATVYMGLRYDFN